MLHNGTQLLFDYWNELRGEEAAPARVDISPAAISSVLPSTFILEKDEQQKFVFRLAGTAMCLLFGEELKGIPFYNLLDQDERKLTSRILDAVHGETIGALLQLDAITDSDRAVSLEVLILPLCDQQPRLLGSIHTLEMPYWAGAEPLTSATISDVRLFDSDAELFCLHNRPSISLADRKNSRRQRQATPRFAVLQGGAMLGGPQANRFGEAPNPVKLEVFDGGRE
jgi:hypothetical protein